MLKTLLVIQVDGMGKNQFAIASGLKSTEVDSNGNFKVAPAAVFTTNSPIGTEGSIRGSAIDAVMGGMKGTVAHEFMHTLGLPDNGYNKGGALNSPPQLPITTEIVKIINAAYKGSQQ